jgi:NAD(P)-dependent dehydrogenase (short-subunit alcohol dehydrogenase family)
VAHNPNQIFFTGRNAKAAEKVIAAAKTASQTKVTFIECDQTSLESVKNASQTLLSQIDRLDIIICNAGVMGTPAGVTKDGYETQWGINYLAHALFIKLLKPQLEKTSQDHGDARIVLLSSNGFKFPPSGGIVFKDLKSEQTNVGMGGRWIRYGQSKLGLVLLADELAERHPTLSVVPIHPGVIWTGLMTNRSLGDRLWLRLTTMGQSIPLEHGPFNTCWAATTSKDKLPTRQRGSIFTPVGVSGSPTKLSTDKKLGSALWDWTEEVLSGYS